MKWVIAGGTGYIGQSVSRYLVHLGYEVVVLSRTHHLNEKGVEYVKWTGKSSDEITSVLEGADVLLNLSGQSVDARYTSAVKEVLYESRLIPTRTLGKAMKSCANPPSVWLQMSTATVYSDNMEEAWDESGEMGSGFSVDLAKKWEDSFHESIPSDVRGVVLRTAIVLGREGGAYPHHRALAKFGIRGFGGRNVRFSWIHEFDFNRAVVFLARNRESSGVYNLASEPCGIREFMDESARRQASIPVAILPTWMIEVGTFFLRTESELLLKSRHVRSSRLLEHGFEFRYPHFVDAVSELESRSRKVNKRSEPLYDWG